MDPLIIHYGIRHRLSRIKTNNFQDKSGCSINGIRSFLFEEGIVQNLDDVENLINNRYTIQDYRGYSMYLMIRNFNNFPLSDEILRMKNVEFYFPFQSKPIHKLVSPQPHFIEEERNLIENHFSYVGDSYDGEDIEEWRCFQMDNEGHLVSISSLYGEFQFSNESIEHLSNFPQLTDLSIITKISSKKEETIKNFSLLSNLRTLSLTFNREFEDPEFFKDLGLFSNLLYLYCYSPQPGILLN